MDNSNLCGLYGTESRSFPKSGKFYQKNYSKVFAGLKALSELFV